jgi:general secretion pathway protein H
VTGSRKCRTARGFTLIELLIVLAVIALASAAAVPALAAITGANARKAAGELAGSMRALVDVSGLRNATCRLAIDVDKSAWWAECAPGRAGIARDADRASDPELEERFPDEKDAEVRRLLARTKFGKLEDRLVKKRELPGSTRFGPVEVEGRRDAVAEGVAYVYFFPGGQAQRAVVPIVDGSNRYTVVLEPFTGRARVVSGEVKE